MKLFKVYTSYTATKSTMINSSIYQLADKLAIRRRYLSDDNASIVSTNLHPKHPHHPNNQNLNQSQQAQAQAAQVHHHYNKCSSCSNYGNITTMGVGPYHAAAIFRKGEQRPQHRFNPILW